MGRASSRKKAMRAARAGAPPPRRRRLGWPLAVVVVVAGLGVALLAISATNRSSADAVSAPTQDDHWHAAYAVSLCGELQPPLSDDGQDTSGIHTHEDGLIHLHPHSDRFTGEGANLGAFADRTGLELDDERIQMPDGPGFDNGDDCDGEPGVVQVKVWDGLADDQGRLLEGGFEAFAPDDGDLVTIAFAPASEGADLPKPPSAGTVPEDLPEAGPVGGEPPEGAGG